MPIEFQINLEWLKKKLLNSTIEAVTDTTNAVYSDVRAYSPIDTGQYLSWHRNKGVRVEWNKVIWEVENNWEYSERVEEWFRKSPVNWRLANLWQIYYSKGANVYAKAIAKNKDNFLNKLKKW